MGDLVGFCGLVGVWKGSYDSDKSLLAFASVPGNMYSIDFSIEGTYFVIT